MSMQFAKRLSAYCAPRPTGRKRGPEYKEPLVNKNARTIFALLIALLCPIIPGILLFSAMQNPAPFSDLPEYYAPVHMIGQGKGALIYVWEQLGAVENALFPGMNGRVV